jgi:hypothetical protein
MLQSVTKADERLHLLSPPETARVLVDNDYIMASLGVLSKRRPEAALRLLRRSLGISHR